MATETCPVVRSFVEPQETHSSEIDQLFKRFDANGDGKISAEELTSRLKSWSTLEEDYERVFKVFDTNGDGVISSEELASFLNTVGIDDIGLDLNGDGSVDFDKLYDMLDNSGDNSTIDGLKEAFDLYDKDQDENSNHVYSIFNTLLEKIQFKDLDCKGAISTLWKTFIWQLATTIVRKLADKAAGRFLQWFRL